ncbi:hypothetical protein JYU34_013856 [Plutella xylostella]|uniref:Uncharacterized protein n=1 Tax=Plutella xylostella TaxID=51655 RepID=A0ABQ7QAU9_PLUXY|nr:hypothetical protein JYU34_013856 [Plutella xylostella]
MEQITLTAANFVNPYSAITFVVQVWGGARSRLDEQRDLLTAMCETKQKEQIKQIEAKHER